MSLTHYWKIQRPFSSQEWSQIADAARIICQKAKEEGIDLIVEIAGEGIQINGSPPSGHEDLILTRLFQTCDGGRYSNVKTAWKPYDLVVCTFLIAVHQIAPTGIDLKSDGNWDGQYWLNARNFYQKLFHVVPNQAL